MKLPFNSNQYFLGTMIVYLSLGIIDVFVVQFMPMELLQLIWIVVMAAPLVFPMQKIVHLDPVWKGKKND